MPHCINLKAGIALSLSSSEAVEGDNSRRRSPGHVYDRRTGREIIVYRLKDLERQIARPDGPTLQDFNDICRLHPEWGIFEMNHYLSFLFELASMRSRRSASSVRHEARLGLSLL